ncbi:HAD family phosphatase [Pseudoxanthomonas sp. SGNA-20]|uniref:HAD superfamily hydrolase (TIGR01509 family) n=1 Tax=Pseudoxanthomonas taiwanensis J19 TaxID=935569 RepID=A0A562E809_9GAMM|nr:MULTISPECIES: HAD family phosphatase [Pseudoxanthomonas]RRN59117.1 HAD family phosphatase [Pseudoxanthomonas sp. SGNA-20]TWH17854.1 HAD superfamily hydrolase (TIGR01509 family) [Pseudoxanthomonas taiwanensis J19]
MSAGAGLAPLPFAPEAVLFDMDGLMLDSERAITRCYARAAAALGHDLPEDYWLQMVGTGDAACRAMLVERLGQAQADALLQRSGAEYSAMVDAGIPHRPGILALLQWLQERGVPRAVATSTRNPLASHKLRQAGLLPYFPVVCTASDVAHPKPAPDVYLLAASRLGVEPARCLVLEDSPAGVRAALAAGMTPIQVPDLVAPDAATRALGHRIAASLEQVLPLLQAVFDPVAAAD